MKPILTIFFVFPFVFLLAGPVPAQVTLTRFSDAIHISEDHLYARENSVVFVGPEYVTVVGATWCPRTARLLHEQIAGLTSKPVRQVINTNYHPDRAGGNAYWKSIGCEIHATRMTYDLLQSDWQLISDWTRQTITDYPEVELCLPTVIHPGRFQLQDGRIHVLYLGPSHTRDGVFVHFPEEKVLYGGCILKPFLGNLEQADLDAYPVTLHNLKAQHLDITTLIAGHGHPVQKPTLIDQYLSWLEEYTNSIPPHSTPQPSISQTPGTPRP